MGSVVGAIGSIAGGLFGMQAAEDAADEQIDAYRNASRRMMTQFAETKETYEPYMQAGLEGLFNMGAQLGMDYSGIPGMEGFTAADTPGAYAAPDALPDYSGYQALGTAGGPAGFDPDTFDPAPWAESFETSPGYEFRRAEGQKALEGSFAARGALQSGAAQKALMEYGQDYASNEYQNYIDQYRGARADYTSDFWNQAQREQSDYWNQMGAEQSDYWNQMNQYNNYLSRLSGLAGMGQTMTQSQGALGSQAASGAAGMDAAVGQAAAGGLANQYNILSSTMGQLTGMGGGSGTGGGTGYSTPSYNAWAGLTGGGSSAPAYATYLT